jgi:allophanate hydrolase subunit 2
VLIARCTGLVTIQDLGRPGRMHEAIPPGGALVPSLLVTANRRAGNADAAPALEVLGRVVLLAEADLVIATDARPPIALRAGDELAIASGARRVTYAAPRGGLAVPDVLGGRGALVCAALGPIVRAGDRLAIGGELDPRERALPSLDDAPIRVIPGPDGDAFADGALATLASTPYRISPASDRTGTRLVGPALARRAGFVERSRPMVRGAIEVPGDGQPIVLGPEHPTTGGYPLIGVVASDHLDRLSAIRLGGSVRFAF